MDGDEPLYRYDPMRGAVLSRTPPPNRDITLRELLGLGRSDIADKEVQVKPEYPKLHDDPLAKSPVPPAERKPLLIPWLSNLIFEHDGELKDPDEARDEVLTDRSNVNVTLPGPDTANFPNSAFTLPKGRAYIENSPATFFGKSRSFAAQYNWEFLLRYGLTDDLEFRLFSSGYSATLSHPRTTGFSPLAFDFKYHMWDENLDLHIPAAGAEIYILTPFGSNYFSGGTQPSIALLLDHTLPFDILLEHNFGLTGIEDTFGGAVYEFSYQWRCNGRCSRTSRSSRTGSSTRPRCRGRRSTSDPSARATFALCCHWIPRTRRSSSPEAPGYSSSARHRRRLPLEPLDAPVALREL